MSNHFSSHSHTATHHPTKAEEAKAAKAGQPTLVETIQPPTPDPDKPEKETKAPKVKLLAFDADRFAEELEATVADKSTTPNNPTMRAVLAELATILQRSRTPKPTAPEKDE